MTSQKAAPLRRIGKAKAWANRLFIGWHARGGSNRERQIRVKQRIRPLLLRQTKRVELIKRLSGVGVGYTQLESQIRSELPVVSNVEEGMVLLEWQLRIAFCDETEQRGVIHEGIESGGSGTQRSIRKEITAVDKGKENIGRLLISPVH